MTSNRLDNPHTAYEHNGHKLGQFKVSVRGQTENFDKEISDFYRTFKVIVDGGPQLVENVEIFHRKYSFCKPPNG